MIYESTRQKEGPPKRASELTLTQLNRSYQAVLV
jgi:hypothetical protein